MIKIYPRFLTKTFGSGLSIIGFEGGSDFG